MLSKKVKGIIKFKLKLSMEEKKPLEKSLLGGGKLKFQ